MEIQYNRIHNLKSKARLESDFLRVVGLEKGQGCKWDGEDAQDALDSRGGGSRSCNAPRSAGNYERGRGNIGLGVKVELCLINLSREIKTKLYQKKLIIIKYCVDGVVCVPPCKN